MRSIWVKLTGGRCLSAKIFGLVSGARRNAGQTAVMSLTGGRFGPQIVLY